MAGSEAIGVGTVIIEAAMTSLIVIAAPRGAGTVVVAVVAMIAQVFFLLWLGGCTGAAVTRLLRSTAGTWVAAFQMSVLLALSFAGWVPVMALILPGIGSGDTTLVTPTHPGKVPAPIEDALLALPTGWGLAAVDAASPPTPVVAVAAPIAGLIVGGALLRELWIGLTAHALRQSQARTQSNISIAPRPRVLSAHAGPIRATTERELKTWFRDPHRRFGLAHAWFTPLLMILLVAPTGWWWATPFIGVMAAGIAAMVAVTTYALDGTALWQLLTTPNAIVADIAGRQCAWMILFGTPILVGTALLGLVGQSPFWAVALGMTFPATGAACAGAPLLGLLMPAIGADARDRVSTSHNTGNAAGGQWTALTAVAAVAAIPVVLIQLTTTGSTWFAPLGLGMVTGAFAVLVLTPVTRTRLRRSGPALLPAMASGDLTRLRRQT